MSTIKVFILMYLLFLCIFPEFCCAETVVQETKGNQSPTVFVSPGGSSNITYKIDAQIDEVNALIKKHFSECFELSIAFQKDKLEELNKTLADLLSQNEGIAVEDAKAWARKIIDGSQIFKEEIENKNEQINKYNKELSKDLMAKTYKTFFYIFEQIDTVLLALKEVNANATYTKCDKIILFSDENAQIMPYIARSFVFSNGTHIDIKLNPGLIKEGLINLCPSLIFAEITDHEIPQNFKVEPRYGRGVITLGKGGVKLKEEERPVKDITYEATGQEMLTNQFKEKFYDTFSAFMKIALMR